MLGGAVLLSADGSDPGDQCTRRAGYRAWHCRNIRAHYPRWLLYVIVGLLLLANTINLGADLGAMAAALKLLIGGPANFYVVGFAVGCTWLEVFSRYRRYVSILKWGSFVLLAYVAVALVVPVPWALVVQRLRA